MQVLDVILIKIERQFEEKYIFVEIFLIKNIKIVILITFQRVA